MTFKAPKCSLPWQNRTGGRDRGWQHHYFYSCALAATASPGQISEIVRVEIIYSTSSATTYFSVYPHYDLATSHTRLLRCEQLPRFGALEGCSKNLIVPNHAEWTRLVMQSCTCANSPCTLQTSAYKVAEHISNLRKKRPSDG